MRSVRYVRREKQTPGSVAREQQGQEESTGEYRSVLGLGVGHLAGISPATPFHSKAIRSHSS